LAAVAGLYQQFQDCRVQILAISTDSVLSHKVFHEISPHARQVTFPLLADRTGDIAKSYGVYSSKGTAYRATFLIDPIGIIRHYAVYPDEVGREINEVLRVVKGLQIYDQTQQLEPAGWLPGMAGIQPMIQNAGYM